MDREKIMQELSDIGQEMDLRDRIVHYIAAYFDHPSVFMGGPSEISIRRASRLVANLEEQGYKIVIQNGENNE